MVKNKEASWCISSRSPNGFCIFRNQQSTPIKTVLDKKNCVYKLNWSKQTAMVKDFLVEHFYSLFFLKKKTKLWIELRKVEILHGSFYFIFSILIVKIQISTKATTIKLEC